MINRDNARSAEGYEEELNELRAKNHQLSEEVKMLADRTIRMGKRNDELLSKMERMTKTMRKMHSEWEKFLEIK